MSSSESRQKRKRHDLIEAHRTLAWLIEMIESGYNFQDQNREPLIREIKKISALLKREADTCYEDTPQDGISMHLT